MAEKLSGIIDPPIDDLLSKVDSKYQLVIFASKRARQINDYYADLHEGSLFEGEVFLRTISELLSRKIHGNPATQVRFSDLAIPLAVVVLGLFWFVQRVLGLG